MIFVWDDLYREHIAKHGATPGEAEEVVRRAQAPFPLTTGDEKRIVWGRTRAGRQLQVIFVHKSPEELSIEALSQLGWARVEAEVDQENNPCHSRDGFDRKDEAPAS